MIWSLTTIIWISNRRRVKAVSRPQMYIIVYRTVVQRQRLVYDDDNNNTYTRQWTGIWDVLDTRESTKFSKRELYVVCI